MQNGYYLIANVFKSEKYMYEFANMLRGQGLTPKTFLNTENGFRYVYLAKYTTLDNATKAFKNSLNGKFKGDMWIIKINNSEVENANIRTNE